MNVQVELPLDRIVVGERVRKDMGDLDALVASIERVGLIHPPTVRSDGDRFVLVAGERRLAALRQLGIAKTVVFVAVKVRDALTMALAEREENTCRKDFTPSEAVAAAARIEPLERAAATERQGTRSDLQLGGNLPPSKARDKVAEAVGMKARTYEKAREVVAAASDETLPEPVRETARRAVEHMDRTGKVDRAHREVKRAKRDAKLAETPPPDLTTLDKFPVLYVDPPWRYEHAEPTREVDLNQYQTLTVAELSALPVPAAEHAVLFLWATSPKLAEALAVMEAWGFSYRTSLVWVKHAIGMGYYARQRHEFLLVGRKGDLPVPNPENRPDSVIEAPRNRHSAKPDIVYGLIERMYPHVPRVELFARQQRPGWVAWGSEAEAVA